MTPKSVAVTLNRSRAATPFILSAPTSVVWWWFLSRECEGTKRKNLCAASRENRTILIDCWVVYKPARSTDNSTSFWPLPYLIRINQCINDCLESLNRIFISFESKLTWLDGSFRTSVKIWSLRFHFDPNFGSNFCLELKDEIFHTNELNWKWISAFSLGLGWLNENQVIYLVKSYRDPAGSLNWVSLMTKIGTHLFSNFSYV